MADSIESALEIYLNNQTSLTSIIGGQRVYYQDVPPGTDGEVAPFVEFFVVDATNLARTAGLKNAGNHRFQFDIWASAGSSENRWSVLAVGKKIIEILRNYTGDMEGVHVDIIRPHGVRTVLSDDDDSLIHGIVEAEIKYIEP